MPQCVAPCVFSALTGRYDDADLISLTRQAVNTPTPTVQTASQHCGSVPCSVKVGSGILSVEAPDGSHRSPCERRPPMEADIRPVQAVWRKGWPGSQRLCLSPRRAQTQEALTRAVGEMQRYRDATRGRGRCISIALPSGAPLQTCSENANRVIIFVTYLAG